MTLTLTKVTYFILRSHRALALTRTFTLTLTFTKVPYFVVRPKAAAGPVPTILYGYGGFQISMTPKYAPHPSPNPNPHP